MCQVMFGTFMYIIKFNSPNKPLGVDMIPSLADTGNEIEKGQANQLQICSY